MHRARLVTAFEYELLRMRGTRDEYHFRVEVFCWEDESNAPFFVRVWQMIDTSLELSLFKSANGSPEVATMVVLAEDQSLICPQQRANSVEEIILALERVIAERFEPFGDG